MRPSVLALVVIALVAVTAFSLGSASYKSDQASRLVQLYSLQRVPQPQASEGISVFVEDLQGVQEGLSSLNLTLVNRSLEAAEDSPLASQPLAIHIINLTQGAVSYIRDAYHLYLEASSYYTNGQYGLAIYYANQSLGYLSRANVTIIIIMHYAYLVSQQYGQSAYTAVSQLAAKALSITGLFTSEDELLISAVQLASRTRLVGSLSVLLKAPSRFVLGSPANVSGYAIINGSRPLAGVPVVISYGSASEVVVTNSTGGFAARLEPVYNSSGVECVIARVGPTASVRAINSSEGVACAPLSFVRTYVNVSVWPETALPGGEVNVSITYSGPGCAPPPYYVDVSGQTYSGAALNGTALVTVRIPANASGGVMNISVYVGQSGECAPAIGSAQVTVTKRPSRLTGSAVELLPGLVVLYGKAYEWPALVSARVQAFTGNVTAGYGGGFIYTLPTWNVLPSRPLLCVVPYNSTYGESCLRPSVVYLPTPALAVAVVAAALVAIRRRAPALAYRDEPTGGTGAGAGDQLASEAWAVLSGIASRLGALVTPSTTFRELANYIGSRLLELRDDVLRLDRLLEARVYGGDKSKELEGQIRELLRQVGDSGEPRKA